MAPILMRMSLILDTKMFSIDQLNLHHSKDASLVFRRRMDAMQTDLILIQEPYYFKGIRGLGESGNVHRGGALNLRARACIFSRKGLNCRILPQFSDLLTS
jgi:hypothetical protein